MLSHSRLAAVVLAMVVVGLLAGVTTVENSFIRDVRIVDTTDNDGDGHVSEFGMAISADTDCVGCNDESEDSPQIEPYFRIYVDSGDGYEEVERTDVVRNDPTFETTLYYSRLTETAINTAESQTISVRIELWDADPWAHEKIDQTTFTVDIESPSNDENTPPTAAFTFDPRIGQPGQFTLLNASQSSDPDAPLQAYRWDVDGDGTIDATGETVRWTVDDPGEYEVRLVVVDAAGATDTITKTVTVTMDTDGDYLRDAYDPFPEYRSQPIVAVVITVIVLIWYNRQRLRRVAARIEAYQEQ